jgi:hypothetical protein
MDDRRRREKIKSRSIIKENSRGNIEFNASSQGNDFSLGGDDDIDVDNCG